MRPTRVCVTLLICLLGLIVSMGAIAAPAAEENLRGEEVAGFDPNRDYFPQKVDVRHSSAFTVEYHPNYKILTVTRPWPGATAGFRYVLVQRGTPTPQINEGDRVFEVPVRSLVTMSTTYLAHVDMLELLDVLVGHDSFAYVSTASVLERIEAGDMQEVGSGSGVNVELLLDMQPELIMSYGMGNEWDAHPKLDEVGLPYVINAEWNETTPLGRAEWIKFMAVFFNAEAEAEALFSAVEREYTRLKDMVKNVSDRPRVFMGSPYQGTWWVSGGASFAAGLMADAGATYVWAEDESTGSLMLDIELVYEKAHDAEFWVSVGYWGSRAAAAKDDERFTKFDAWKTSRMYNNDVRMGPGGGNEYYESGPANPHRILADLISIFHPDLLPDYELYYYRRLD